MNAVEKILNDVTVAAKNRGLNVFRYQTNLGRGCRVSYGVTEKTERPLKSADCEFARVIFNRAEGTTERCAAYRALADLLTKLS